MKTIIAVIFLVFTIIIGMSMIEESFSTPDLNGTTTITDETNETSSVEEQVKVILTGEVINPGTYTININEYLDNAIQLAGGTTTKADYSCFNFFYVVTSDVAIYIAPISDVDKISINDAPIEEIVKLALERKTGARGLRAILEEVMLNPMYDVPSNKNIKKCIITKEVVTKEIGPIYEYKE